MSKEDRSRWNARYADGTFVSRPEPSPFLETWLLGQPDGYGKGKRALDLACGAGRNSILLAQHGYEVDAMDVSDVALAQGRTDAEAAGVAVNWIELDLDELALVPESYDLIVIIRFRITVPFEQLVSALCQDGVFASEQHLKTHLEAAGPPKDSTFRWGPNELLAMAKGLRILWYREGIFGAHSAGPVVGAELIASKGDPAF